MEPGEIIRLAGRSRELATSNKTAPEAFILAQVAWEGLRYRILIVGHVAQGLSVADAKRQLDAQKPWNAANYRAIFKELFGSEPSQSRIVGRTFRETDRTTDLRNRYVHGHSRTSPDIFLKHSRTLWTALEFDWEGALRDLLRDKTHLSGPSNPLGRLRKWKKSIEP